MLNRIKRCLLWRDGLPLYAVVVILAALSYYPVRSLMTDMSAFSFIDSSPLTLNMILLFGLWGGFHHKLIKTRNWYAGLAVLLGGFILIVLALRLIAGIPTIFG